MPLQSLIDLNKKPSGSFYRGLISPFTAIKAISGRKGYAKFFILPLIINMVLLAVIFYISYSLLYPCLNGFLQGDSWLFTALRFVLTPILTLLLGIIFVMLYSITGSIATAPFNDLLSLKVEKDIGDESFDEKFSMAMLIKDIIRITLNIIKLLLFMLVISIVLLLLNLIPLVGPLLYSVLSFMMTSFFFGFQYFDFPLERRRLAFGEKLRITWHYKFMVIGLGTTFFILSFIPIVGFFIPILAAIGATTLFINHIKPVLLVKPGDRGSKKMTGSRTR